MTVHEVIPTVEAMLPSEREPVDMARVVVPDGAADHNSSEAGKRCDGDGKYVRVTDRCPPMRPERQTSPLSGEEHPCTDTDVNSHEQLYKEQEGKEKEKEKASEDNKEIEQEKKHQEEKLKQETEETSVQDNYGQNDVGTAASQVRLEDLYEKIEWSNEEKQRQHATLLAILSLLTPIPSPPDQDIEMQLDETDSSVEPKTWAALEESVQRGHYDTDLATFRMHLDALYGRALAIDTLSTTEKTQIQTQRVQARTLIRQAGVEWPRWRLRSDIDEAAGLSRNEETESGVKRDRDAESESNPRPAKVALFQRSVDAFLFSSPRRSTTLEDEEETDESKKKDSAAPIKRLAGEVREITVLPIPSLSQVPTLGEAVGPAPTITAPSYASTYRRREWSARRVQPVAFLDYGPFSSFAPGYDVNLATLSPFDSARIAQNKDVGLARSSLSETNLSATTTRPDETTDLQPSTPPIITETDTVMRDATPETNSDTIIGENTATTTQTNLKAASNTAPEVIGENNKTSHTKVKTEETISASDTTHDLPGQSDVDLDAVKRQLDVSDTTLETETLDQLLARNADILFNLQQLQDERFSGAPGQDPKHITELEHQLAKRLTQNLARIVAQLTPAQLGVSKTAIRQTMSSIPYFTAAYRGTLPPSRPFAYASNHCVRLAHPPAATVVPGTRGGDPTTNSALLAALQMPSTLNDGSLGQRPVVPGMMPSTPQPATAPGMIPSNAAAAMMARSAPPNLAAVRQHQMQLHMLQQMQKQQQAPASPSPTIQVAAGTCINCGAPEATAWRASVGMAVNMPRLCNACGFHFAKYQTHRPIDRWANRA